MTRFTKTKKALCALTDTILGGSSNVVRNHLLLHIAR